MGRKGRLRRLMPVRVPCPALPAAGARGSQPNRTAASPEGERGEREREREKERERERERERRTQTGNQAHTTGRKERVRGGESECVMCVGGWGGVALSGFFYVVIIIIIIIIIAIIINNNYYSFY